MNAQESQATRIPRVIVPSNLGDFTAARVAVLSFSVMVEYGHMADEQFSFQEAEVFLFWDYPELTTIYADGNWDFEHVTALVAHSGLQLEPEQVQ